MSCLVLVEDYSSGEEHVADEEAATSVHVSSSGTDDEEDEEHEKYEEHEEDDALSNHVTNTSYLPSAFEAFSEISGPPEFLNNCVDESVSSAEVFKASGRRNGGRKGSTEAGVLPAGAVVEAKAQLVGIGERVRNDVPIQNPIDLSKTEPNKRVRIAMNPSAEDAAELLRMCVQCGIPKTYRSGRGMVCPECGDRVRERRKEEEEKRSGPNIKERERSKRMKGQSSHSTWKTETEMQLRQHFD